MLFFITACALLVSSISADSCDTFKHQVYGQTGRCIPTENCPNALYISGLCESQPANIKCCFSSTGSTGSTSGTCPSIVSRATWGARAPTSRTTLATPVPIVVIHHTTGSSCTTIDKCMEQIRGFQNYHMNSNGWSDIGYNFLVGEDGSVYEGRGWTTVGAHCYGYNSRSIGITVIGDYTSRKPNDISLNAVKSLIDCGISKGYISSGYTLHGHRDLDATTCPGNVFYNEIRTWPKYRATARSFSMPQFEATEDSIVSQYP